MDSPGRTTVGLAWAAGLVAAVAAATAAATQAAPTLRINL
jgi:hypothetical protein